jgi:hypothetical protein
MSSKIRYYTGIGSRKTPSKTRAEMIKLASELYDMGWWCRTGDAEGADGAFIMGSSPHTTIYKPKDYYEGKWKASWRLVLSVHPAPEHVIKKYQKVLGRNPYQLLGYDLDEKSEFVVCWTPGGKAVGGTAVNIKLAEIYDIPVFNLFNCTIQEVLDFVK